MHLHIGNFSKSTFKMELMCGRDNIHKYNSKSSSRLCIHPHDLDDFKNRPSRTGVDSFIYAHK